jgi:Glycosyltransferase family 87
MATTELTRSPTSSHASRASGLARLTLPVELNGPRSVTLLWVVSRAGMMLVLGLLGGPVTGDVLYYARSMHTMFYGGTLRQTLQEYPVPVLGIMLPQYVVGALNSQAFAFLFVASMLAVDAAFTAFLWRVTGRCRSAAVTFWLLFAPAMGPIAYFRFDLVPAVLTGTGLLALVRRPRWTGALTAVGVALKLWPIVMLPVFLLRRAGRAAVLSAFLVTGAGLAAVSLIIAGYGRFVSPVRWQGARGLQIEAVPATPLMLVRAVHAQGIWNVRLSRYKATEIFGAGVPAILLASTAATVVGLVVLSVLWLRCRRSPDLLTLGWMILAAAAVLTVTNKTLSPQYILWLGGPVAALFVIAPRDPVVVRSARVLLVLSVCTQVIYPIWYDKLVNAGWQTVPMTLLLVARNVLLVWLAWLACAEVWRRTSRADAMTPDEPSDAMSAGSEPVRGATA